MCLSPQASNDRKMFEITPFIDIDTGSRVPELGSPDDTQYAVLIIMISQPLEDITETQQTHDVKIRSLLRQNDVAASFWCNNNIIIIIHCTL